MAFRRIFFFGQAAAVVATAVLVFGSPLNAAQWKPSKPIELVVGAAPGGSNDHFARAIQKLLVERKLVDVPVSVINKPGGSGAIAFSALAQHAGDAHYLVVVPFNLLTNHIIGRSTLNQADVSPLAQLISEYTTVMVRNDSPLRTARELAERLKQDPTALSVSIGTGRGNGPHIAFGLAMKTGGVDVSRLKTVVFQSGGESNTAVMGGHVDVVSSSASNAVIMAGKLRALAISAPERQRGALASIPTWREQGIDATFDNWRGIAGPKGLSAEQLAFWDRVFMQLAQSDDWKKELDRYQWSGTHRGAAAFKRHLDDEYRMVRGALTDLGMAKQ